MRNTKVAVDVWDIWIRLFHWGLVAAVLISFYTTKTSGMPFLFPIDVHAQAGYLVLGLLVFRLIWGLLGSVYARFSSFLYSPSQTAAYSKALLQRQTSAYASHNPLGGWMVVIMLLSLGFQAVSGLFLSDDIFFQGPLYGLFGQDISGQLRTLHSLNSDLLLILIGLHLVAVAMHRLLGERLLAAMLSGTKHFFQPPIDARNEPLTSSTLHLRAIGAILIAAGVVLWLWF
ncbi:MAG: cytochrome B [Halomonas sp.]|nr:cytochrome b/b6 domain-containing protein [Halomonas sp.]TVP51270.1 MAG: cytochrome B [Halomonas sp.]